MVTLTQWSVHLVFGDEQPDQVDRWLFHYTTADRAASIALLGALSLSPLSILNDPRESKERQVVTMTSSAGKGVWPPKPRSVSPDERVEYERQIAALRDQIRVACFTRDGADGEAGTAMRADSRGYARPRMWAQYGDRHRGVCLIFDRDSLIARAQQEFGDSLIEGDVAYAAGYDRVAEAASIADFDNPSPDRHFEESLMPALFRKNADWQGEREFRIFVRDHVESSALLPVDDSLVGLVLGVDFGEYRFPAAAAVAERFQVGEFVAQLYLTNGVLTPYPVIDAQGVWRRWSEDDLRTRGVVFDEEDP